MPDKNITDFTPDAQKSAASAAIARAKSSRVPVGGAPMPEMPRLDQPPPDRAHGVQSVRAAQKVLTPEQQRALQESGKFVPGVGSAYAANQPAAGSLPTDTEGRELPIDPRLMPRPPGEGLRPETVKELEALAAAQAETAEDKEDKKLKAELEEYDDVFETNEFGERVRSLLANKKRKEAIESRCAPMNFEELLVDGSVKQKVPIIPGAFEPVFRSTSADESVEILRLMGPLRGPEQYLIDTLSIFRLTAGLYAIGTKILPNHLNKDGDFDEELFKKKLKIVGRMGLPIVADLTVNHSWFQRRVQKLTVVDNVQGF